jgi:tRNA A-37 threonylcarbamoyl transferase component Bud32
MPFSQPSLSQVRVGGVRWSVDPALQHSFLDHAGLRLPHWLSAGQAHVVKQGPHRVVYRVELPGLCFYLKHNRVTDTRTWIRQLVRPSKARQEFDKALAVAARGVPTIAPLALGEQPARHGGESFLITRGLEACEPLNAFLARTLSRLDPLRRTRVRQRLAEELGRLVARIHDAGILHNDFHAGNLLVHLGAHDAIALYLIDLDAVRVGKPLDWPTTLDNLVMLNSWFVLRVNRADRLRFWSAYFRARGLGKWGIGPRANRRHMQVAEEIEARTWQFNLNFWRRRDARCLKSNRYYCRLRGRGVVGHAVTELDRGNLTALVSDPDEPFRRPGIRLLKNGPSSTVAELEMMVDGKLRKVIYKRFRVTSMLEPFISLVRRTPAVRSWAHGQGFRERALPTARPLAVLHRTRWGLRTEGYLLTEKIEHAEELHRHLESLRRLPDGERLAASRSLIDRIARIIRDLHARQLSHRDLKASNILVRRLDAPPIAAAPADSNQPLNLLHMPEASIWLIDLVGVELFRRLPLRRKIQNLARLNASFHHKPHVTMKDRLRFLRTYLHGDLHGRESWKKWWKLIERATQEKAARNRRHGRPLE